MDQAHNNSIDAEHLAFCCAALVGPSAAMRRARSAVQLAAQSMAAVLVTRSEGCLGESIARLIHDAAGRPDAAFTTIDCGNHNVMTTVSTLAEGRDTPPTTVFLDHVDRLPRSEQARLADGYDRGRLGVHGSKIRLVAGTYADLKIRVSEKKFRQDLYYHLAVLAVEIPPLRLRREDVSSTFLHFLRELSADSGRPVPRVPRRLFQLCDHYPWPGNTRELRCVVERVLASTASSKLSPRALPDEIRQPTAQTRGAAPIELPPEGLDLEDLERNLMRQALEQHSGNRTHAARMLGLSRQTFLYRMKKYGLQ